MGDDMSPREVPYGVRVKAFRDGAEVARRDFLFKDHGGYFGAGDQATVYAGGLLSGPDKSTRIVREVLYAAEEPESGAGAEATEGDGRTAETQGAAAGPPQPGPGPDAGPSHTYLPGSVRATTKPSHGGD